MRWLLLVMAVVVVFAGCESKLDEADKAFAAGDYDNAIKLYNKALKENKYKAGEMAEIRYKLGKSYQGVDRLDQAVEQYRLSIDLKPSDLKPYLDMADCLDELGMYEEEIHALRNALILDKDNPHAEMMLGVAYAKLGQYMNALAEFKKALSHNPRDPENYLNLGLVYDKLGDTGKAIGNWEEALKLNPDYEPALQNLAAVYNRQNDYEGAIRVYKMLVEVKPGVPKLHNNLGVAYYNSGRFKEAHGQFQMVKTLDSAFPGVDDYLRLAKRGMTSAPTKQGKK